MLICRLEDSVQLIARVPYRALDIRVHARVVERAGENCHRDRTRAAAAERSREIPALPGGDTADDQPDGNKYRSDVHLGLHCIERKEGSRDCRPLPWPGTPRGSIPG